MSVHDNGFQISMCHSSIRPTRASWSSATLWNPLVWIMRRYSVLALLVGCACFVPSVQAGDTPAETVNESAQVLSEFVNMAGKQIPQQLLAQAQGVVIVPNVIKLGFIAGGRRGRGVVMSETPKANGPYRNSSR
jgi:hypothetical protein